MERIHQYALDKIARYDDDKFDRHIGYLKSNLHKDDLDYLLNTRRIMREHGETFPRQMSFTLIHR
jgi:hypothetical protein